MASPADQIAGLLLFFAAWAITAATYHWLVWIYETWAGYRAEDEQR